MSYVIDSEWNVRIDVPVTFLTESIRGRQRDRRKEVCREARPGRVETLLRGGKHPAQRLTKARILLKADAGEAGEGWSDSQIAAALETSVDTVARTRQRLVEESLDDALKLVKDNVTQQLGGSSVETLK